MKPDDRRQATDLDRHWDALAFEANPPEMSSLDRETAALIDRMWAWSAPPDPAMARERVWQQLRQRIEEESEMGARALTQMPSLLPEGMLSPNGRVAFEPTPKESPGKWRVIPGYLATAAVLVLALVVGLFASGSLPRTWGSAEPTGLPAVLMAPATPATDEVPAETLLDLTIPPEQLPRGERVSGIFEYATSPAGSTGDWLAANSAGQPGLRVHHVLDGSIILRAEDATQVVRAGDMTPEDVAADTEVTLEPGDTWIARNETVFEVINPADTPAHILIWILANVEDPGAVLNYPVPSTWIEENYVLDQPAPGTPGIEVPAGSARLRIQRIELGSKESFPAPSQGLQYGLPSLTNADGSPILGPSVASQPSGKLVNLGREAAIAYVLTFAPSAEDMGTPQGEATNQ